MAIRTKPGWTLRKAGYQCSLSKAEISSRLAQVTPRGSLDPSQISSVGSQVQIGGENSILVETGIDLQDAFAQAMDKRTQRDRERHASNPKLQG